MPTGKIAKRQSEVSNVRPRGLWTVGARDSERAVAAMLGRPLAEAPGPDALHLKVDGIDVRAVGRLDAGGPARTVLADGGPGDHVRRRIVVEDDHVVGAVLVGPPGSANPFGRLMQPDAGGALLAELRRGNWSALDDLSAGDR